MDREIRTTEIDEIKTDIASFDMKINGLKMERDQLYAEIENIQRGRLSKLVGMCFIHDDGSMDRIIDVDKEKWYKNGRHWNPYQMKVLKIPGKIEFPDDNGCFVPFQDERLYTRACDYEDPIAEIRQEYREITPKVFSDRFDEVLAAFRKATGVTD